MTTEQHDPIGSSLSGGRYEVTAKLGEGGMGAVYRAKDHNLSADVVIKLPHRSMVTDAEFSRRFRDEVRSLVRLSHPHIVKVTDVGDWTGVPFAVLQFLPGGSLEDRQSAWRGPAALAALGSWLGPVGGALDYVHSQGMVHRDVKPGNILFDSQGHAFLGDFGVVKVLAAAVDGRSAQTAMTGTGMVLGTPHYMAPELIMGDPFDGRVDQYALAVTAYELLCGRRPFEHDVVTRVLMMQTRDTPPSPAALCPGMSARLEEVLLRSLAKDPKDRYASCAAFAAAVVEATGSGRGAQAGRARLKCGSCGQTLTVSVEALAKLSRSGRTEPCPRCKSPLDLTAGTAVVLPPSPSGEMARGDTAVLEVGGGTGELKTQQAARGTPSSGSETVVIGGLRSSNATVPDRESFTLKINAEPQPAPMAMATAANATTATKPPWVPIGLAAAAVALIGGLAVFWATASRNPAVQESPALGGSVASTGAAELEPPRLKSRLLVARNDGPSASRRPKVVREPFDPQPDPTPTPSPSTESRANRFSRTAGQGAAPGLSLLTGSSSGNSTAAEKADSLGLGISGRTSSRAVGKTPGDLTRTGSDRTPPAHEAPAASAEQEPVPDDEKPSLRNVPLAKLLASPESYGGRLVTLEQVYCIGKAPWRMPDGSLRVELVESKMEIKATNAKILLGTRRFVLRLDSRLADRLISLGKMIGYSDRPPTTPNWIMQPSNLTVKVDDLASPGQEAPAKIVRLEMFEGFDNQIRGTAKKIYVVRFRTQTLTAAGATSDFGNPDEWKKVPKLGSAYNDFQSVFSSIQKRKSQMKWDQVNAQMNQMIAAGMRQSAAEQSAIQSRARQLSTTPANFIP